jgi:hypothetical protein
MRPAHGRRAPDLLDQPAPHQGAQHAIRLDAANGVYLYACDRLPVSDNAQGLQRGYGKPSGYLEAQKALDVWACFGRGDHLDLFSLALQAYAALPIVHRQRLQRVFNLFCAGLDRFGNVANQHRAIGDKKQAFYERFELQVLLQ